LNYLESPQDLVEAGLQTEAFANDGD